MPLVTVYLYPGRTSVQKQAVVRGVTDVLVREAGVTTESVEVMIIEVPREHWAFGGSLPEPKPGTIQPGQPTS
jgi:4-oxalocrotonate tautomerase